MVLRQSYGGQELAALDIAKTVKFAAPFRRD
jgi:hypothetical protein